MLPAGSFAASINDNPGLPRCATLSAFHRARAAIARSADEKANPIDAHLLGAEAIVNVPDALAKAIENPGGSQHTGAALRRAFIAVHSHAILSTKPSPGGHPNCPTYGHPNCPTRPGVT